MDTQISAQRDDEIVRVMIQNENEIINHRVSWLNTIQGLLFASLGIIWDKHNVQQLMYLLCSVGICTSIFTSIALVGSSRAISQLYHWWEANKPSDYKGPGVMGLPLPRILISRYVGPWSFFPVLFLAGC